MMLACMHALLLRQPASLGSKEHAPQQCGSTGGGDQQIGVEVDERAMDAHLLDQPPPEQVQHSLLGYCTFDLTRSWGRTILG